MKKIFLIAALWCTPALVSAQATGADSAQAVLNAAQVLQREGQNDIARDLMRYLVRRWPESPAAATARAQFPTLPTESLGGFGRTSFVAYHVLYGAFLGAAIPAALGADDPEGYGLGLLLGAPLGFFASKAYAKNPAITDGQAGIIQFGSFWGTWQGFGWQSVLDIGEDEFCDVDVCYTSDSDTAPWAMAVAGGVTGLGVSLLAARTPISGGTSSMVFHSSLWGTYFGLAAAILAEGDDNSGDGDDRLTAALIGGNIGLLFAIPAAHAWKPTSSRVRIASATGLAGGLAGLGVVLLTSTDDTQGAIAITTAGAAIGLIAGAALGKDKNDRLANLSLPLAPALVSGVGKAKLGIPVPYPTKGGVGFSLVDFRF
ncbi:MAG TPA: hypothetical protein VJU15_15785 [Gemmatimonadales bacterium]|nr:hypothetical protein [Gemmatimonadales bacterium]